MTLVYVEILKSIKKKIKETEKPSQKHQFFIKKSSVTWKTVKPLSRKINTKKKKITKKQKLENKNGK